MRIALVLEYDGGAFHGWQSQTGLRTVQAEVESALTKIANHPVQVVCAGRTDKAVHAKHQVVHFDTLVSRKDSAWIIGANHFLPQDIVVRKIYHVPDHFHACIGLRLCELFSILFLHLEIGASLHDQHRNI